MHEQIPLPRKRPPHTGQIRPLTSLRYFLALWVVTFHQLWANLSLGAMVHRIPEAAANFLHTGYAAVSAFFALSGFVLAYNYKLGERWTGREMEGFFIARLARIYPMYLLGLVLLIPYALVDIHRTPWSTKWYGESLAANLALMQSWIPTMATSWNFPGWSLSDEAFFYLSFPFLGVLIWRTVKNRWQALAWGGALFAAQMLVPVLAILRPIHGFGELAATMEPTNIYWAAVVKYNPLLHLGDFLLGVLTARVFRLAVDGGSRLLGHGYWFYGPGLAVALTAFMSGSKIPYPLMHNGLLTPVFACVILGFALGGGRIAEWLSWRFLVLLGQASYGLYILQWPITHALTTAHLRLTGSLNMEGMRWFVLYVALATGISVAAFLYVEEPCSKYLRGRLNWRKKPVEAPAKALSQAAGSGR